MPIYEYQCAKCGTFDVTQRISDAPLRKCPTCKSKVTKLLSAPAVHFKGTGWYVTDYASKGRGEDSKSDGSSDKSEKSEKKDAKSSDSKSKESSKGASKGSADSKAA